MAWSENVHHHTTYSRGSCHTTSQEGPTNESIQSAEDDLRQLDRELDHRISQVLKLAHPPQHVPRVKKIAKVPLPKPSQKTTTIPPHIHNTGGIISIHNGKVEVQRQTIKSRTETGVFKVDAGSLKEAEGAFKVKGLHLAKGDGVDVGNDEEWETGWESVLPAVGTETPHGIASGKPNHIIEAQEQTRADGQNRNEERNAVDNYKEMAEGGRDDENDGTDEEVECNNKEKKENAGDESDEEILDDQDAIFDEFLDAHTRGKIRLLTTKVEMLTQALQSAKDECMRLSNQKREMSRALQDSEAERRVLAKRVTSIQQDSTRCTRTNRQLDIRVKELTAECQTLRKEASCVRKREGEQRGTHNTLQAQLSRARAESASLQDQLATFTIRHKEEVKVLRGQVGEAEKKWREVERARRNLTALTAKQQRLIEVLQKQKSNIAAGKAVAALEEKFLATIAPLQPH